MRRIVQLLVVVLSCLPTLWAADSTVLDSNDVRAIEWALHALKMSPADLAFKKDQVDSELVLQKSRQFLQQPLALAGSGRSILTNLQTVTSLEALTGWAGAQLEIPTTNYTERLSRTGKIDENFLSKLPPPVARAVTTIFAAALLAEPLLPRPDEAAWAAFAVGQLNKAELDSAAAQALAQRADNLELQDDALAQPLLAASDRFDRAALLQAVTELSRAVDAAIAGLETNKFTEAFQIETDTPLGKIICGGSGANTYTNDAFLIIDLAGDDTYLNSAGGADGRAGRPISIVIDLAGNDQFIGRRSFSQGAGVFGVGILAALGSNLTFTAKNLSQGAGFFGWGLLMTGAGQQQFTAESFCQGAGMFGAGILWQRGGDTRYQARQMAQGFGGVQGVGLLLDESGNDLYFAAGTEECPWIPGHYFTLAQGFGYGMRPFAGGGVGVLCDLNGNDHYVADVYGQGASYWYSTGWLLDAAGSDSYAAYQYCQGAGIHLSSGALIDWAGNDQYTARAICQGGAHDYSVGLLIDRAGNDRYIADTTAQGAAINNSFALLLDHAGDDFYAGRDPQQSQAAGHDGGPREYGSIALLLDLAGTDTYSQAPTNNTVWLKPSYGAGVDGEWGTNVAAVGTPFGAGPKEEKPKQSRPERRAYSQGDTHHPIERLLRRALRDPDTAEHRQDAAAAWKELKEQGTNALPYLVTRLDSPDVMVRAKFEELVELVGTNAVPALVGGLDAEKNAEVARLCCYFLARFPTATNAVPRVLPLLDHAQTRPVALYTLGHWRAPAVVAPALAALTNQQEMVRLRAAQALGRVGSQRGIPALLAALDDALWDVRYAAAEALVALGKPSVGPLRSAFKKATPRARAQIIAALAKLGDRRAAALARAEWRDNPPAVRAAMDKQLTEQISGSAANRP